MIRMALFCFWIAVLGGSAVAQEQTILIDGPVDVLNNPSAYVNINEATLDLGNAPALIDGTLGAAARASKNFYCIIHVLRWSDAGKLEKQNWYIYSDNETASDDQFMGLRIFGSHNVAVLYVHLNAKGAPFREVARARASSKALQDFYTETGARTADQKEQLLRFELSSQRVPGVDRRTGRQNALKNPAVYDPAIQKETQASGLDVKRLADLEGDYLDTLGAGALTRARSIFETELDVLGPAEDCHLAAAQPLMRAGRSQFCVLQSFNSTTYKVEVTKKLPSSISDLFSLALPHGVSRSEANIQPVALWGGRRMRIVPVPSDLKVTPSVTIGDKATALDSRTYDNEGRYYWDVSAAIPLKRIQETDYDATTLSLTPKKIERQSLYAVLNVFPFKVDTKGTNFRWFTPALLVGMAITEKPLERLLFAGAIGLNKVQFFGGWSVTRKQFPGPASNPGAVTSAYRTNSIFGLNVPIRQVLKALKAAK